MKRVDNFLLGRTPLGCFFGLALWLALASVIGGLSVTALVLLLGWTASTGEVFAYLFSLPSFSESWRQR